LHELVNSGHHWGTTHKQEQRGGDSVGLLDITVTGQFRAVFTEGLCDSIEILKNAIFWDIMLYGSCKNRHFGGTQCV
jgi:hypothetical protein